ncbi:uncharacterized protein LOC105209836 isoform X2 [Zeugodacus cucurbitae]|uniref:uncharacterized protein LOC105209836 isoform X2 n=1 Tax=Zeugodacus cucurbitae TaxID=28588 RepID=UPI0023D959A8|nr:uncharacterized protein LOC105209836 isoform X2 [Zeugodacus cucurbitae]
MCKGISGEFQFETGFKYVYDHYEQCFVLRRSTQDAPKSINESLNNEKPLKEIRKLCTLVKKHQLLYNRAHRDYGRREATDAAWKAIAASCGDTVDNCKNRWQTMRSGYKQSLEKKSKQGKGYYLAQYLEFVRPHLNNVCRQSAKGVAKRSKNVKIELKKEMKREVIYIKESSYQISKKKRTK